MQQARCHRSSLLRDKDSIYFAYLIKELDIPRGYILWHSGGEKQKRLNAPAHNKEGLKSDIPPNKI